MSGGRADDPDARRVTPLALKLEERIRREGPISVAAYMDACLHDPEHGYYRKKAGIGAAGDFVTAPEISQVFGELIGLWCAVVWQQMGSPARFDLIELGPGRGTLMADALRATRGVPGFRAAAGVHLVDSSEALRAAQRALLEPSGATPTWHDSVDALVRTLEARASADRVPAILIANEFLDVAAVHQAVFHDGRWCERLVGLTPTGDLEFCIGQPSADVGCGGKPIEGDIVERAAGVDTVVDLLRRMAAVAPLAGLFVDYAHTGPQPIGETLQAVRAHKHVSPFEAPGESDLTAYVDFHDFGQMCRTDSWRGPGFAVDGPVDQADFLGRLGAVERASRLMAANPAKAGSIEMGVARLLAPQGMGSRFKAIGIRSAHLAPLPGLERPGPESGGLESGGQPAGA